MIGGFCLLVELHREGSAPAEQACLEGIVNYRFYIIIIRTGKSFSVLGKILHQEEFLDIHDHHEVSWKPTLHLS